MPYIPNEKREFLVRREYLPVTSGELNFVITDVIKDYWRYNGANYSAANDVLGALDGASKEFYRRVVAPYEDKKIIENGDVYYDIEETEPPREGVEL